MLVKDFANLNASTLFFLGPSPHSLPPPSQVRVQEEHFVDALAKLSETGRPEKMVWILVCLALSELNNMQSR